jgi:hypothetical protein
MSSVQTSSNVQQLKKEDRETIRLFVEKLQRFCHVKGYTFGPIPERLLWNCSYISQRADDECAQVNITFTYDIGTDLFISVAEITRVFFVSGGYDFEWKANYKEDFVDIKCLVNFFIKVDAYVEVPFERLKDNEHIKFEYKQQQFEYAYTERTIELINSLHEFGWNLEWKSSKYEAATLYSPEGIYKYERANVGESTFARVFIVEGRYDYEVYGNIRRKIYTRSERPDIVFYLTIRRKIIKNRMHMKSWIKGYLYQLLKLKVGDIKITQDQVEKRYKNIEEIIQSVHAPQQHEPEGDGGGGGGRGSKGTASQMTTVASILETIHERVSKLEVVH